MSLGETWGYCKSVFADTMYFSACMVALVIGDASIDIFAGTLAETHIEVLEALHFNTVYACLLTIAASSVARLVLHAWEKVR